MKRALTLASVFIALPTAVSGQSTDNIYLDCDVIRTYSIPDERRVGEKLNFKIDQEKTIIYQFNYDEGIYENTCENRDDKSDFDKKVGSCFIDAASIFSASTDNSIFFHTTQYIRVYRGSGRLRGDSTIYDGPFKVGDLKPKKPLVQYDINGSCVRGKDMSTVEKAF